MNKIVGIKFYDFTKGYGWLENGKKIKGAYTADIGRIAIALKTKISLRFNGLGMIVGLENVLFIRGAKCVCSEGIHPDMVDFIKVKYGVSEVENLSLCYTQEKMLEIAKELSSYRKIKVDIEEYSEIRERTSLSKWHTDNYCCYPNWGYDKPLIKYVYDDIYNIDNNNYKTMYRHNGLESESLKELEALVGIKPTKCNHNHMDDMADSYNIID